MTDMMMDLKALLEKAPDADFLRETIGFAAKHLMEMEVAALTGAAWRERSEERLVQRKWATLASWSNRRSMKYRHTLDGALGLDDGEIAVLAVLMLRGPQTPGELKTRTERLHRFEGADVTETLGRLAGRDLVERLDRRPGQREERYRHLLGEEPEAEIEEERAPQEEGRIERIERELAELRAEVRALRDELGA